MSKALEYVRDELELSDDCLTTYDRVMLNEVLKELERLEEIDNANPSEALEDLIDMIEYFTRLDYVEPIVRNEIHDKFKDIYWHKLPHLDTIKQALLKAQEQEKALEIIKAKCVDMWHLMDMLEQDYIMYCAWCVAENYSDEFVLTQEEFKFLKEVLSNEKI